MILNTTKFGEVEINSELIFDFVAPILGYEHLKKFVLIDHQTDSPFKWLQSTEDMNIALPITVPACFGIDYEFYMPEDAVNKLALNNSENLLTINIVNIPAQHPKGATVNLAGPVVINLENNYAMQLVLLDANHSVKHKLFTDIKTSIPNDEEKAKCMI